jgi:hypothetical protein
MDRLTEFFSWAIELKPGRIPGRVMALSKLQLLNMLAAAMAGLRSGLLPEPGSDPLLTLTSASMIHDFDDFLFYGHTGHSSVFVSLTLAAEQDAPLGEALAAQIAANEIGGRFGACLLLGPHNGQMWSSIHIPSTLAAAGRLRRLDPAEAAGATMTALAHAPYITPRYFFSSGAKFFAASIPIRLSLAVLDGSSPRTGAPAPEGLFEEDGGFFSSFAYVPLKKLFTPPGKTWLTSMLHFKKYPGCAYMQASADGAIKVGIPPADIRTMTVIVDPLGLAMNTWHERHVRPETPFVVQASFSVRKSVAAAVAAQRFDPAILNEEWLGENRKTFERLVSIITVKPDVGQAAGLASRAVHSILLPGLGVQGAGTQEKPLSLKTRILVETTDKKRESFEGNFPAYRFDDLEDTKKMVAAKYRACHRKLRPRTDPDEVIDLVLGDAEVSARKIIQKSLGKAWLDMICRSRLS